MKPGGINWVLIAGIVLSVGFWIVVSGIVQHARGADMPVIGRRVIDGEVGKFGRYGDQYYARRWQRMCNGSARYDAMREAYDLGKRNPC